MYDAVYFAQGKATTLGQSFEGLGVVLYGLLRVRG